MDSNYLTLLDVVADALPSALLLTRRSIGNGGAGGRPLIPPRSFLTGDDKTTWSKASIDNSN